MVKKYSKEETKRLVEMYQQNPTRETVEVLADEYGKTPRSIIAKLSKEGVYVKPEPPRTKQLTKQELLDDLADLLHTDNEFLSGLEKAPRRVLVLIRKALRHSQE